MPAWETIQPETKAPRRVLRIGKSCNCAEATISSEFAHVSVYECKALKCDETACILGLIDQATEHLAALREAVIKGEASDE